MNNQTKHIVIMLRDLIDKFENEKAVFTEHELSRGVREFFYSDGFQRKFGPSTEKCLQIKWLEMEKENE